jgi:hypothetical protein
VTGARDGGGCALCRFVIEQRPSNERHRLSDLTLTLWSASAGAVTGDTINQFRFVIGTGRAHAKMIGERLNKIENDIL